MPDSLDGFMFLQPSIWNMAHLVTESKWNDQVLENPELSYEYSRSYTIIESLKRLQLLSNQHLSVHIVGADFVEGCTPYESSNVFQELICYLEQLGVCKCLNIVLVGPNIPLSLHESVIQYNGTTSMINIRLQHFCLVYDEYATHTGFIKPHVSFCFNAGIWGYDEWLPSINLMCNQLECPVVITSYNMYEAEDDQDALEQLHLSWLWEPQRNQFGSLVSRDSQSVPGRTLADNAYWQCVHCK